jgi:hypothetical protein
MTKTEQIEKCKAKIDEVMERFDFKTVHAIMTIMKWQWAGEGVPTIPSLKQTARQLLEGCITSDRISSSHNTGGFRATREIWSESSMEIRLVFEAVSTGSHIFAD